MAIFKKEGDKLIPIKELKIDLEKELQGITEKNLECVLGLKFISSEFPIQNFRIDTLAYDEESNAFVIIEYKRDRSFSVVDQGFAYLSLLLNNKDSFILEYIRKTKVEAEKISIDWSQSRVLFMANAFTPYQQNAINFKDLPIELWKVKKFSNGTILYNQVESANGSESINKISRSKTIENVSKVVRKYSIDDHFGKNWQESRDLFEMAREKVLSINDSIVENPNPKPYIGYKVGSQNFVSIYAYKSKIMVAIARTHPNDLNDPEKKARYRENSMKYFNQHITDIDIHNESDMDYAVFLIKQIYNKFYR